MTGPGPDDQAAIPTLVDHARILVRWASAEATPGADEISMLLELLERLGELAENAQGELPEDAPAEVRAALERIAGLAPLVGMAGGFGASNDVSNEALGVALSTVMLWWQSVSSDA